MGQNPNAQAIQKAMQAHILEHVAFQYRRGIEQQLGVALPAPGQKLSPDLEAQISKLSANGAQRLLQQNQSQAAQQAAQQQAQDPLVQMQQKELQLKEQELQDKKFIELEKLKTQKEIAMVNNEAKLLLQNEDAKVEGLFKGMDLATAQQSATAQPTQPPTTPAAPASPYAARMMSADACAQAPS